MPSADHYPLRNTSHLLLVSKAFRQLALPFLLHSIVITRPEDWVIFFGAETGLFVGEEGAELWKHVRTISLDREVLLPIRHPYNGQQRPLWPLVFPSDRRIERLCILHGPSWESPAYETDPEWYRRSDAQVVLRHRLLDEASRRTALANLIKRHEESPRDVAELLGRDPVDTLETLRTLDDAFPFQASLAWLGDRERWDDGTDLMDEESRQLVRRSIDRHIFGNARHVVPQERAELVASLIQATCPKEIHEWDASIIPTNRLLGTGVKVDRLVMYCHPDAPGPTEDEPFAVSNMPYWAESLDCPHIHLVGYSPDCLDRFILAFQRERKAEEAGRLVSPRKRWTWEAMDDGQTYELDNADL